MKVEVWEPILLVVMVSPVYRRLGWLPEQVLPLRVIDEQIYRLYDIHSASLHHFLVNAEGSAWFKRSFPAVVRKWSFMRRS